MEYDQRNKFSAILKIQKSARRSEAPLAVTSHPGPSFVLHPFFSRACFRTTGTRLAENELKQMESFTNISDR